MIFDRIDYVDDYMGADPNLDLALQDIKEGKFTANIQDGRVTCSIQDTETREGGTFEVHGEKADIHMILEGEERIEVAPLDDLRILKTVPEKDYIECDGEKCSEVIVRPGFFLVVFPGEAHKVKCCVKEPCKIKKVVYKFAPDTGEEE